MCSKIAAHVYVLYDWNFSLKLKIKFTVINNKISNSFHNIYSLYQFTNCNDVMILTFSDFYTHSLRISQRSYLVSISLSSKFSRFIKLKKKYFLPPFTYRKLQNITSQNNSSPQCYVLFVAITHAFPYYTGRKVRCC